MKRVSLILIAAMAIVGNGCEDPKDAPQRPSNTAPSQVAAQSTSPKSPEAGDILSVLTVEHQVDLSSQRDGTVTSLAKDEGSVVKSGEILGQLDDRSLQQELIKARDDLKVTQNNLQYKAAELKAKAAAFRRQQLLREAGLSSQADLEAAEFEAKGAEYDMHGYEALVESGQAEIHRLEIEIDQTVLRAPFSGVVVRRYVREGQAIAKGDKCFRVSQLYPLQVQFQISELASPRPALGAPVNLILLGGTNRQLAAKVVKVSPTVDPSSDSYDVVAQLTGPGLSELRPGMAVRVGWPGTSPSKP
ncbi:MAG TPA: efflux RND transporter periplasmic adaptor subunit [Candidatus Sulfotelmatobacter sp.]|jgi:RND family efflux transporter MFP subunit|nr:efflux RND transporter periplasmic adaptor subunit [Candidatus Sulfotelmatobacter sp.]